MRPGSGYLSFTPRGRANRRHKEAERLIVQVEKGKAGLIPGTELGSVHKIIKGGRGTAFDGGQDWSRAALKPFLYRIINLFSMDDTEYPNLFIHDFEDYPIVPNSQLPIATKCFPKGFTVEMRRCCQAAFNGVLNASSEPCVKKGNIGSFHIRMVSEFEWHSYQTS